MPAKYCSNCGVPMPAEALFCPQCGTAVQSGNIHADRLEASSAGQGTPASGENVLQWTQLGSFGAMQAQERSGARRTVAGLGESILDGYAPFGAAQRFQGMEDALCSNRPPGLLQRNAGALNLDLDRFSIANQNQEAKPRKDLSQILGVWYYQLQTPYGPVDFRLIINRSRQFASQCNLNGLMGYDAGVYDHQEGFLHFDVRDHEPKYLNGQRQHWVTSYGYHYTVVDANNMIFEDRLVGGRFKVVRIQGQ